MYRGIGGKTIEVAVNYMKLQVAQGYGIFEYEVLIEPSVDSRGERYSAVNQHRELLGLTKYVVLLVKRTYYINDVQFFRVIFDPPVVAFFGVILHN